MWEMFAERTPYYFLSNPQSIIRYVYYEDGRPNIKDFKCEVNPEMTNLVETNWAKDPSARMEFSEIVPILQKQLALQN
jgi:hypothetical protein